MTIPMRMKAPGTHSADRFGRFGPCASEGYKFLLFVIYLTVLTLRETT